MASIPDQRLPTKPKACYGRHVAWLDWVVSVCQGIAIPRSESGADLDGHTIDVALTLLGSLHVPPALTLRQRQQVSARCGAWLDGLPTEVRLALLARAPRIVYSRVTDLGGLVDLGGPASCASRSITWLQDRDPVRASLLAIRAALQGTTDVPWPDRACFAPLLAGIKARPPRSGAEPSRAWLECLEALWRFPPTCDAGNDIRLAVSPHHERDAAVPTLWVVRRGLQMITGAPIGEAIESGFLRLEGGWHQSLSRETWCVLHRIVRDTMGGSHG